VAVRLKSAEELGIMREAGSILSQVFGELAQHVRPGVSPLELDRIARERIEAAGAKPAQLGYQGFPATICVSRDEIVVHGIPDGRPLKAGEVISLDCSLLYHGYLADMARTYGVGEISTEAQRLIKVTREAFFKGLEQIRPEARLGDVAAAVQRHVEANGFWVVREFVGHGVGLGLHEDPQVPNFGRPGTGLKLKSGMTLALEPMVTLYPASVVVLKDGWAASAGKGNLAAHYENTVAVSEEGAVLLTGAEED
jgi:methionyl aminopeptidase